MPLVAGHSFPAIVPGARCEHPAGCSGVQSLTELVALADVVKVGDVGIAHTGTLSPTEVDQIRDARDRIRRGCEAATAQAMGIEVATCDPEEDAMIAGGYCG